MAYRGNSGSRGGRGGARGRGRGGGARGGRGGFRGGKRMIFDSARIKDKEDAEQESAGEEDSESSLDDAENGNDIEDSGDDSDDEDISAPKTSAYAALLQEFTKENGPAKKRRKLDHTTTDAKEETKQDDGSDDEENNDPVDADDVEEAEEGPETAVEGTMDDEDDNTSKPDPFKEHFAEPDETVLSRRLKNLQESIWRTEKEMIPKVGKSLWSTPEHPRDSRVTTGLQCNGPSGLNLKKKLEDVVNRGDYSFDELEERIAPITFGYYDLLFCDRTLANAQKLRWLTCLHAVNHVFKTRDRVIKNNARLAKEDDNAELELRDQGFTRPKVLMILPTREACVRVLDTIVSICEPEQQENRKRFDESYVEKDEQTSDDKPADFRDLFAGNVDDNFRLGLKFTRKTIKFFSGFYNSDIILASPLGLRMAIGGGEEGKKKKIDYDFLSSIEIVVVDQADALLMQNWEHMEYIFEHLNLQPKEAHGCDFSRVRSWYLDNNAKHFRQTIALASFNTAELNKLFWSGSQNWAGKVKISQTHAGAITELGLKVKQTFSRYESPSIASDPDARFSYFTAAIIPSLTKHKRDTSGTLIFVPSYLEFVRVRNYFATSAVTANISFASISEYTSRKDVARARSHFATGRHSVLLYTERAHHFMRLRIKGVKKVVMYGLPDNPVFYREIVGEYLARSVREGILGNGEGSVRAMFSKWDILKLERVAGSERVGKMVQDRGDTFDFM